jgi:LysM repeat protein
MNNSNPFIPQGSLLDQKNKKRARVKVAVFSIFAINLLVVTPLLIQGCSKKEDTTAEVQPPPAPVDTNAPDTNVATQLPATPSNSVAAAPSNQPAYQPPPPPAPVEVPTTKDYTVVKGDSYYLIAKKYGVKMKELEAANPNVPATKLKVGMKIQIPASGTSGSTTTGGTTGASDASESVYVVKTGDTLTKIAKSNGVSVKALRAENDLKTDKIKVGQKLKVPGKAAVADTTPAPAPQPTVPNNPAPVPTQPAPASGNGMH